MQRRSFLALLGLGVPAAAVAKVPSVAPAPEPAVLRELRQMQAYRAIDADIGQVMAGILRTPGDKMLIDFTKGEMRLG